MIMASKIRNLLISEALKNSLPRPPEEGNIIRWVSGITPPPESEWKKLFPEYSNYYLSWDSKYGWYDVNKRNPTASPGGIPDGMMCWAATASNLIHWWIRQNKEYVDEYGSKYTGPDYDFPLDKEQESDIFSLFVDTFEDEAGKADEGFNWFVHGIKPPSGPDYKVPDPNPAGFFKDVFPEGVKLASNFGGLSKEYFNTVIKDALNNNQGIGGSFGPVNNGHIMTIWGAEFDRKTGLCNYIYLTDNNDRPESGYENDVSIARLEITYVSIGDGATQAHYKTGYIENPDYSKPITRLVTVDLGRTYWENYFKNNII